MTPIGVKDKQTISKGLLSPEEKEPGIKAVVELRPTPRLIAEEGWTEEPVDPVSPPPVIFPKLRLSRRSRAMGGAPSLPPTLQVTPSVSQTYRFQVLASGVYSISVANVLGALGGICTATNSKINSMMSTFKIRRVTMWPAAQATGASIGGLFWRDGESGQVPDEEKDGSIPEGITATKPLVFTPPKSSLASFWISSVDSSAILFDVEADVGAIIDFAIDGRLCNVKTSFQNTVASGVLGTVYYLALDGPASNKISPTLLPSTA